MQKLAAISALALMMSFAAHAQTGSTPPAGHGNGPCKKIVAQCEAGGYKIGAHKATGKGAYIDCLNKILAGQSVAGVTADPSDVQKCQAIKAKRAARKGK